jgi:UDPglucose 6-dehydrogenase
MIRKLAGGSLSEKTIGIWGLAFKAGTDDIRESPAMTVVESLLKEGCFVRAFDPSAVAPIGFGFEQVQSAEDAAQGADVLVVLTEWPEFSSIDPSKIAAIMRSSVVFDTRRVLPAPLWVKQVEELFVLGEGAVT